jgi:hypothetical protein
LLVVAGGADRRQSPTWPEDQAAGGAQKTSGAGSAGANQRRAFHNGYYATFAEVLPMSAPQPAKTDQRELVDELRDALICLLAVVDLADCLERGVSEDLHDDAKRKARTVLKRCQLERPIVLRSERN